MRLIKIHNDKEEYAAAYQYTSSFAKQIIFVKHQDDVTTIDLLLKNKLDRQAVYIIDQPLHNHFITTLHDS
ncbi:hypothetical protein HN014_22480 (plasmid) [Aquimarina sp. TRL1]|nr:hypothetical protein HN014_22480 [Aquimarina sp. TRL1]